MSIWRLNSHELEEQIQHLKAKGTEPGIFNHKSIHCIADQLKSRSDPELMRLEGAKERGVKKLF